MKKISPSLLRGGSSVEHAMDLFKASIDGNGLDRHTIKGWGPIYLPYLTDPEGWLGVWMLKSDELSALILKCRLWDSIYIKDPNCVQTIRPVNRTEYDKDDDALESYDQYPLAEDIGVPMSMRFVIANLALSESLIIMGNEVDIKPVKGFYDVKKELEEGDILPFQDPVRLSAYHLNKHIFEINHAQELEQSARKDHNG